MNNIFDMEINTADFDGTTSISEKGRVLRKWITMYNRFGSSNYNPNFTTPIFSKEGVRKLVTQEFHTNHFGTNFELQMSLIRHLKSFGIICLTSIVQLNKHFPVKGEPEFVERFRLLLTCFSDPNYNLDLQNMNYKNNNIQYRFYKYTPPKGHRSLRIQTQFDIVYIPTDLTEFAVIITNNATIKLRNAITTAENKYNRLKKDHFKMEPWLSAHYKLQEIKQINVLARAHCALMRTSLFGIRTRAHCALMRTSLFGIRTLPHRKLMRTTLFCIIEHVAQRTRSPEITERIRLMLRELKYLARASKLFQRC